jgi:uncharacterized protein with FMN-binding domain
MIPKRAISALLTTAFALVLLLSFKTPQSPGLAASTTSGTAIIGDPAATAAPATTDASAPPDGATAESGTATATPAPTQGTTTASAYSDGTVTGSLVSTRFGDVQVQVTISGGTITDVSALALPSGDRHSSRISQVAGPILRGEALAAQDANIDLLSGATYTSTAYAQSLQSALDQARA